MVDLKGRSFLTLMDFPAPEIRYLLDLAKDLKKKKKEGGYFNKDRKFLSGPNYQSWKNFGAKSLIGKNILLIFEKTSTRTRCSFEVAALDEGANVTFLDPKSSQFGKKESVKDSAKVFGRFYDGIEYRGFSQKTVEALAKYSGVPVFNGLTDEDHPTQILADMLTIEEHIKKPLRDVQVAFVGDTKNNMTYAWMYGCAQMGMHFTAYGPPELAPANEVLAKVKPICEQTGAKIEFSSNANCLQGADVIYTDVWASMGEEAQIPEKVKLLSPFKVDMKLLEKTGNKNVIFMHCLPAFHDFETDLAREQKELGYDIREVSEEVFNSEHSVVFDEAENRMHTIKAILVATMS